MAQITEKIIEIKTKVEGGNTVKELKEQIAELTKLMDILDKESLEYHKTVDMLVDAEEELTNVMKVGKSQLSAQEGSYNALVNRMAALKKAHKAVTDEASRSRLSDEINSINEQLKEMDAKNGVYVRNVGNYENAIKNALKTPQQELKALRTQLAQLTEGTAEYNAVFARMAQLTHDVTEQQEQLKWSSADLGDILGNVAGVATSIAGGFSAFNALSGLMGGESEELEKAMLQAQRFIQLIQGLEQLEQLGDKIKGLWNGIKNFSDNSTAAAAALGNFNSTTKQAETAMIGASQATSTSAAVTGQAAQATDNLAVSQEKINTATQQYTMTIQGLTEEQKNLIELLQIQLTVNEAELAQYKAVARAQHGEDENLRTQIENREKGIKTLKEEITRIKESVLTRNSQTKTTQANTTATQANTAATNAQSAANVTAAATTGLFSKALGILKTALISTGIGAILIALGALLNLLGKGLGSLWDWISGANKAQEQTENLQNAFNLLNETLEAQEKAWERQEMLMDAQGKSYEEIYEARRKNLQIQLSEVRTLLASQQAIANDIGQRKLQKEKYDEFRKTLEELVEKEKELKQTIDDLDYKNYIDDIKAKKKADEEAAAAAKKAADAATAAYNKQKEGADKLYKDLIQHYKDEKTKLKEKYEEEKALLDKFGKDTTLLTKKYEEDKTAIVLKEENARRKAREEYQKLIDSTFRNSSLEYFENEVDKAIVKMEDFNDVNSKIARDNNGIVTLEGYAEAIKFLNQEYGYTIESVSEFDLVFQKVQMDYEDAQKALQEYKSGERVKQIENEFEALNALMELETEKKQIEFDLYASQGTWYNGFTNNYISQMKLRWEIEDSIFQLRTAKIKEEIELYKNAANDKNLTDEARAEAFAKLSSLERQLALETADYTIAQNQRKAEAVDNYVVAVQDSLDGISSILSNVADAWETSIQAQVDAGEISEEEGERQMENMRGIQSAIALINAFSSAVSAYNSMASIPYVGPALGAAAAAAALASGIAQVVAINKVKKGDKGNGESVKYAEVTPTIPDYNPTAVTNVTGVQEQEDLANALSQTNLWVSVSDIDSTQSKVKTRDKETSF